LFDEIKTNIKKGSFHLGLCVGMSEDEFDKKADEFRDARVWEKKDKGWVKKYNLWD
jgi:hypothetical protein